VIGVASGAPSEFPFWKHISFPQDAKISKIASIVLWGVLLSGVHPIANGMNFASTEVRVAAGSIGFGRRRLQTRQRSQNAACKKVGEKPGDWP
jgi:hypothetical protein